MRERRSDPSQDLVRGPKGLARKDKAVHGKKAKVGKTSLQDRADGHGRHKAQN